MGPGWPKPHLAALRLGGQRRFGGVPAPPSPSGMSTLKLLPCWGRVAEGGTWLGVSGGQSKVGLGLGKVLAGVELWLVTFR